MCVYIYIYIYIYTHRFMTIVFLYYDFIHYTIICYNVYRWVEWTPRCDFGEVRRPVGLQGPGRRNGIR